MNGFLKYREKTDQSRRLRARIVSYADDFVILSRGKAAEALDWTRRVITRLGLALNEAKTRLKDARRDRFEFLVQPAGSSHPGSLQTRKRTSGLKLHESQGVARSLIAPEIL